MSTTRMAFDDSRARRELGCDPRPARQALADSVRWFLGNGYVAPRRAAQINLRPV
jgi:nucleoside-diphosphate-sugar epimerase